MEKYVETLKGLVTAQRIEGLVVGIVGTIFIGMYGFWTTDGNARTLAAAQVDAAVIEILAPICAAQARQDPDIETKLGILRSTSSSFEQRKLINEAGWTTFGELTLAPRRLTDVTLLCRKILLDQEAA